MSLRVAVGVCAVVALVLLVPSLSHAQRRGGGPGGGQGQGGGGRPGAGMQQGRQGGGQGCSGMTQSTTTQQDQSQAATQTTTTQGQTTQTAAAEVQLRRLQVLMSQQTDMTLRQALNNGNAHALVRITAAQELGRRSAGVYR